MTLNRISSFFNNTFSSLKHKNFRYFWIGQCFSLMGTWMQRTAQVWLVYTLTNSPFLVGVLGVCQFMPLLLFSLFAGVFIDRFPKKRIVILTQLLFMIQAIILTVLTYSGAVKYWHILVLSVFFGITQTVDMPARQSFIIEMVGKEDLMNGISLNSTIVNLARIVGPALSGIVMLKFGIPFCFLINAASFTAVLLGLFLIKTEGFVPSRVRRSVFKDIAGGLNYIWKNETLIINALFMAAVCTFAMNSDVIAPIFASTVLLRGAEAYTNLLTAAGIGSFVAAIALAYTAKSRTRKRILIISALVTSSLQIIMFFVGDYFIALLMSGAIGFVGLAFINAGNSIFQLNSSDEYRGRVMSVYSLLSMGSTPAGNFFAGSVMERFGGALGYPACGAATILFLIPVFIIKRKAVASWLRE